MFSPIYRAFREAAISHALERVGETAQKIEGRFNVLANGLSHKIMSDSVYSEINIHITWHTKSNLPLIKPAIETKLYQFLKHKIIETSEVYFHAVGGIEDHIHLAVSVPPSLLMSEWIGQLKGASSYHINQTSNHKLLQWQRGYGIVSFGTKDLQWVINYVLNQKEHHKKGTTHERLEKITNDEES